LLWLSDGFSSVKSCLLHLEWSSLHWCYQRHQIIFLSNAEADSCERQFGIHLIVCLHLVTMEMRAEDGTRYLVIDIDHTPAIVHAWLNAQSESIAGMVLPHAIIKAVPV